MTGKQRIQSVLKGEWPDRRPVMLHNFLMAAAETGYSMRQYREDPEKIAASHIQAAEKYDLDGILLDVDTSTLAGAIGVAVDFPENEPARAKGKLLQSYDDLKDLDGIDISANHRISIWLEAARIIKRYFGEEKYLRANCDQAPFSLASMVRGTESWMTDLITMPEKAHALLKICSSYTKQFIKLMARTGADMVSNGDSPAGPEMISPALYIEFAWPYEKEVIKYAHDLNLPYILHICGNTDLILEDMVGTGADGLELDYKTNIKWIREVLSEKCVLLGNLDPVNVIQRGSTQTIKQKVIELLEYFKEEPRFILNAGCAIPHDTPPENIQCMIQTIRNY